MFLSGLSFMNSLSLIKLIWTTVISTQKVILPSLRVEAKPSPLLTAQTLDHLGSRGERTH
jgi:hypothetical protein